MSYSLYETIRSAKYENSIILTYGLNIKFYESIIWMRLCRNGCLNNILLVDGNQYNQSFTQEKATIDHLGKGYAILPIYSLTAFHPKIILLTNKNSGKLIIGSANITAAAFTHHRELVNECIFEEGTNEEYLYLFNDCWSYMQRITQDIPSFIRMQLDQVRETTPWLKREGVRKNKVVFISYPHTSTKEKVIDSLTSTMGATKIKELNVLSPFFDKNFRTISSLKKQFDIKKLNVIIDEKTIFDPASKPLLKEEANIYRFSDPLLSAKHFSLHAKAMHLRTDKGNFMLCGSMNFTSNALGLVTGESNYEAGLLYRIEEKDYFDELGLSKMLADKQKINIDDITFEKKEDEESIEEPGVLLDWAESFRNYIEFYIHGDLPAKIKKISIGCYDRIDRLIKEIEVDNFRIEGRKVSVARVDDAVISKSSFLEVTLFLTNGTKKTSHKVVLNKIEQLREATAKSDVVKAVRELSRVIPGNQDYEGMLELLRYCLFDSYNYDVLTTQVRAATVKEKPQEEESKKGKLTLEDVVSHEPGKAIVKISSNYLDSAGNFIKEIFINTFLKPISEKRKHYLEEINEEFEREKSDVKIIKEEEQEELEEVEVIEEGSREESKKTRDKDLENRLLKRLVKRYVDHISFLEKNLQLININIENELVRHYAVFWMVLKGLDEKYSLLSNEKTFSLHNFIWFNLFFSSSLINKDIGASLTHYIEKGKFQYEQGFSLGACSLITGFCLTDLYAKELVFKDRFDSFEKRREDRLWLINRILILNFVSRFDKETLKEIINQIIENFKALKKYVHKSLNNLEVDTINNYIKEARDVAEELNLNELWNDSKSPTKKQPELKRGDLVFVKDIGIYIVKERKTDCVDIFGGVNGDNSSYLLTMPNSNSAMLKLDIGKKTSTYFSNLLEESKSFWWLSSNI